MIEGLIARGDERVGELIEQAFTLGARLDPWSEYFRKDIWKRLFENNQELVSSVLSEKTEESFPWSVVDPGTTRIFLKNEELKSNQAQLTSLCMENCTNSCGICGKLGKIVKNNIQCEVKNGKKSKNEEKPAGQEVWRMLFSFTKKDSAVFIPHLGVIEVFSMAFLRSGLQPVFTKGFNPHLRLEFASPAAVGLVCGGEMACVDFDSFFEPETFSVRLNRVLPSSFSVIHAEIFNIPPGTKKHSLPPLLYGFLYAGDRGDHCVKALEEKAFRLKHSAGFPVRKCVLARNPAFTETGEVTDDRTANVSSYTDYFDAYKTLCETGAKMDGKL
jgi:hypothetical protein